MFYRFAAVTLFTSVLLAQSSQPDSRSSATPDIKASTQLVIIDVTVTDSHRKPVHNLKASDFVVLEDNVSQDIRAFEEHAYVQGPAVSVQPPPLPPGVFTNFSPVPSKGSLTVLLLDTLNTSSSQQTHVIFALRNRLMETYVGQIQFVTYVHDHDGQLITRAGNEVHTDLPQAGYATLFRGGLHFVQQISVPDKGDYYLRTGVRDLDGDYVGATEFPVAAVRNLPPESVGGSQL